MSEIKFYIPKDETIPTDLRLYVGDVYVHYERIRNGFRFHVSVDDENKAIDVTKVITDKMKREHDESQHGGHPECRGSGRCKDDLCPA